MTRIAIDAIRIDNALQPRAAIDPATVAAYAEIYRDALDEDADPSDALGPLVVYRDGTDAFTLTQGFHRLAAAKAAGLERIAVEIRQGDQHLRLMDALGSNRHGKPLTNADKHRACRLYHDHMPSEAWSDTRTVARLIGCSHAFVANYRASLSTVDKPAETPAETPAKTTDLPLIQLQVLEWLYMCDANPDDASDEPIPSVDAGSLARSVGRQADHAFLGMLGLMAEAGLLLETPEGWQMTQAGFDAFCDGQCSEGDDDSEDDGEGFTTEDTEEESELITTDEEIIAEIGRLLPLLVAQVAATQSPLHPIKARILLAVYLTTCQGDEDEPGIHITRDRLEAIVGTRLDVHPGQLARAGWISSAGDTYYVITEKGRELCDCLEDAPVADKTLQEKLTDTAKTTAEIMAARRRCIADQLADHLTREPPYSGRLVDLLRIVMVMGLDGGTYANVDALPSDDDAVENGFADLVAGSLAESLTTIWFNIDSLPELASLCTWWGADYSEYKVHAERTHPLPSKARKGKKGGAA